MHTITQVRQHQNGEPINFQYLHSSKDACKQNADPLLHILEWIQAEEKRATYREVLGYFTLHLFSTTTARTRNVSERNA